MASCTKRGVRIWIVFLALLSALVSLPGCNSTDSNSTDKADLDGNTNQLNDLDDDPIVPFKISEAALRIKDANNRIAPLFKYSERKCGYEALLEIQQGLLDLNPCSSDFVDEVSKQARQSYDVDCLIADYAVPFGSVSSLDNYDKSSGDLVNQLVGNILNAAKNLSSLEPTISGIENVFKEDEIEKLYSIGFLAIPAQLFVATMHQIFVDFAYCQTTHEMLSEYGIRIRNIHRDGFGHSVYLFEEAVQNIIIVSLPQVDSVMPRFMTKYGLNTTAHSHHFSSVNYPGLNTFINEPCTSAGNCTEAVAGEQAFLKVLTIHDRVREKVWNDKFCNMREQLGYRYSGWDLTGVDCEGMKESYRYDYSTGSWYEKAEVPIEYQRYQFTRSLDGVVLRQDEQGGELFLNINAMEVQVRVENQSFALCKMKTIFGICGSSSWEYTN